MTLLPELALGFLALFAAYLLGARRGTAQERKASDEYRRICDAYQRICREALDGWTRAMSPHPLKHPIVAGSSFEALIASVSSRAPRELGEE